MVVRLLSGKEVVKKSINVQASFTVRSEVALGLCVGMKQFFAKIRI